MTLGNTYLLMSSNNNKWLLPGKWMLIFLEDYMKILKAIVKYFSIGEILLWGISVILITISFCLFDKSNYLTLVASLIGVTSLIFNAKGNPIGQILLIIFSLVYGYISFIFKYYGEMLTYVCMTMPMAVFALVSWLTPLLKEIKLK